MSLGNDHSGQRVWRDVLLASLGLVPCVAIAAAIWECTASYETRAQAHFTRVCFWAGLAFVCQLAAAVLVAVSVWMRHRLTQANQQLSEQAADLNTTLCSIADAVIGADLDERITRMNQAAASLTGWTTEDAVGKPLAEVFRIIDPLTRAPLVTPIRRLVDRDERTSLAKEAILIARDHVEHHILSSTSLLRNADQRVRGAVVVFHDVTAEHDVRKELRESEELHRGLMESLPAGVVIVDPETRVIESINPYAAALFGASADKIVGRRCHSLLCPADEHACPIVDLNQTVDNSERVMLRANGSRIPILKSVKRIQVRNREKLLECFVNLTAMKRTEEDLQRAKQALEQHVVALRFANQALEQSSRIVESGARAKRDLLANMSHEIRTVMTAILGFADRLLAEPGLERAPAHRVAALQTIARNGRQLLVFIDEVLAIWNEEESERLAPHKPANAPARPSVPTHMECRILLAEDTPDVQSLISAILTDWGAEVTVVNDGQSAVDETWAAVRQGRPFDVVLMDMLMPILDGHTATQRLRFEGYEGPIVALTTHCKEVDRQRCLVSGCNDLVEKPIDYDCLLAIIAESIAAARRTAKPAPSSAPAVDSTPVAGKAVSS
jgi:PAS domain S-box-containing protein